MKKTSKILAVVLAALLVVAAVAILAACDDPATTGTAYGIVHGGCIGKATITYTDGKITAATLDEAQLPKDVKPTAEQAETYADYVVGGFWKTVKWGSVVATYDETLGSDSKALGYKIGEQLFADYMATEANAKAYFEAAAANEIYVQTGAETYDKTIMTAANLLKSNNGYWQDAKITNPKHIGWAANVEATLAYVIANGFDGFEGIEKTSTENGTIVDNSELDAKLDNEVVDTNGVRTGATWSDFMLYFNLLKAADAKAK